MSTRLNIEDIIDIGFKRFKGESFDLRELVTPNTLMVRKAAENSTPRQCFDWVVVQIKYPWRELPSSLSWLMTLADLHFLFRHPPRPKLSLAPLDYWKFPNETLRDGIGDCEDTAFLTASMMRAAGASTEEVFAVIGTVLIDDVSYGHAWVEWGDYVLETTYDTPPIVLPLKKDLYGKVFFPEMRFNDKTIEMLYYPKSRMPNFKTSFNLTKKKGGGGKLIKRRTKKVKYKKQRKALLREITLLTQE